MNNHKCNYTLTRAKCILISQYRVCSNSYLSKWTSVKWKKKAKIEHIIWNKWVFLDFMGTNCLYYPLLFVYSEAPNVAAVSFVMQLQKAA